MTVFGCEICFHVVDLILLNLIDADAKAPRELSTVGFWPNHMTLLSEFIVGARRMEVSVTLRRMLTNEADPPHCVSVPLLSF